MIGVGPRNNIEFYNSPLSAQGYLSDPVTPGEDRICEILREVPGTVIEVGCGAGRMYEALGTSPSKWVGVDYAQTPLQLLAQRHPDVRVVQADAAALPFANGTFGAALLGYHIIESILPAARRRQALAEAARVVEPGGEVIVTRHLGRSYHRVGQVLAVVRRQAHEFGDLVGPARHGAGEFRMHVLGSREMAAATRLAGLVLNQTWDYRDGGPVSLRSVSVVERYSVLRGVKR